MFLPVLSLDFQLMYLSTQSAFHGYFILHIDSSVSIYILLVALVVKISMFIPYRAHPNAGDRWHLDVWPTRLVILLDLLVDLSYLESKFDNVLNCS